MLFRIKNAIKRPKSSKLEKIQQKIPSFISRTETNKSLVNSQSFQKIVFENYKYEK